MLKLPKEAGVAQVNIFLQKVCLIKMAEHVLPKTSDRDGRNVKPAP